MLQVPLASVVYRLLGASTEVTRAAETYFYVRIWSAPFALANYVLLGWLVGLARADTALALQIAINVVNIVATVLLVLHARPRRRRRGVRGGDRGGDRHGRRPGDRIARRSARGCPHCASLFDRERLMRMFVVNRDIMIRTAALIAAWAFFTAQGARAGDVVLAANSVLHNLILVGAFFLDGFATAAEQLCGRAVGARDERAFRRAVRLALGWGFGIRRRHDAADARAWARG